ncbi:acetyl-CoA synthetase-like protein [Ceratobasidium sp. AG-I]|nr:acetyl-CoA synthetase-like protein [Ceratobasidium sp. AG-I]
MSFTPSGFTPPPTDGSIALGQAVDFHLDTNPSKPFAILYNVESHAQTSVDYEELAHTVHRAAHILNPGAAIPQGTRIGILISTDTLTYVALVLGAMRAGLVPFPISPYIPVFGISRLLDESKTSYVLVGGSPGVIRLGNDVRFCLPHLDLIEMPSPEDLFPSLNLSISKPALPFKRFPELQVTQDDHLVTILHSSGSDGIPRPIPQCQGSVFKNIINQATFPMYANPDAKVGTMSLPTFHILGLITQCLAPLFIGYTQVLFAPQPSHAYVPVVPTAHLTIQAVSDTCCEFLLTTPRFLETFSGVPLPDRIGNTLARQGVRLHSGYCAIQLGFTVAPYDPSKQDPCDWAYMRLSDRVEARFQPRYDTEGSYELMFLAGQTHEPFLINLETENEQAYRTKDLVVPHPSKPNLWKIVGRLDDQIVLISGEKLNPSAMESEIIRCPIVQYAAIFGHERNQTGVLIELTEDVTVGLQTREGCANLIAQVWPYIERANQTSSSDFHLARNAIIFADPVRLLPRTSKGTVLRKLVLKSYEKKIAEMYAALKPEASVRMEAKEPKAWTNVQEVQTWLKKCVEEMLERQVDPEGNWFQLGMDRNALDASGAAQTREAAAKLNYQTIFTNPTVSRLTGFLVRMCTSKPTSPSSDILHSIRSMIQKYEYKWTGQKISLGVRGDVTKERVVVTGTTGALGSHLLAVLLESDAVESVWALNRKSKEGGMERQRASFEDKMLDVRLLESEKLNAWPVKFNLALHSFEDNIQGARVLLDLAFRSPRKPRFLFTSSMTAAGFGRSSRLLKEKYLEPEDAVDAVGYGQSKLVTEKILESARAAGLETCVVRIGQLAGDEKSGAWYPSEWIPSMITSSVSAGCLPIAIGHASWLPLDIGARLIVETCTARDVVLPPVIHTSHPHPVKWAHIMALFSEVLGSRTNGGQPLPIVPLREWNERVSKAASTFNGSERDKYRRFPSARIQAAFDRMLSNEEELQHSMDGDDAEAGGTAWLDTTKGQHLSKSMRDARRLGKAHVEKWVEYWERKRMFISSSHVTWPIGLPYSRDQI